MIMGGEIIHSSFMGMKGCHAWLCAEFLFSDQNIFAIVRGTFERQLHRKVVL